MSFSQITEIATAGVKPFIHVEGEATVPSGITLFAATGGRWNVIELPEGIVDLPLAGQMPALAGLMRAYLERYRGHCPFFGRVLGFRLVRRKDSLHFRADCEFIERIDGPFRRPFDELKIVNKTVESLFR
jgi:hypothetical protein